MLLQLVRVCPGRAFSRSNEHPLRSGSRHAPTFQFNLRGYCHSPLLGTPPLLRTLRSGSLNRWAINIVNSYMMYISIIFPGAEEWPYWPIDGGEILEIYVWICSRKC